MGLTDLKINKKKWVEKCAWCGKVTEVYAYQDGEDENGDYEPIPMCKKCYEFEVNPP